MSRGERFNLFGSIATSTWWMLMTQGVCLILFGLLVLLVPRILVFLVAMLFVGAGAFFVSVALRVRRYHRSARDVVEDFRFRIFRD
jgi:hypothetical protein